VDDGDARMSEVTRALCPDGAKCHHGCGARCWRVDNAGPLSGVFPGDGWPSGETMGTADLSFGDLSKINRQRCVRWHPGFPTDDEWTGADWSNAMCGEAGEAANVVKKLRRVECSLQGRADPPPPELLVRLGEELADTIIYADLLASKYGVDLPAAIVRKFNAVSIREGLPERLELREDPWPALRAAWPTRLCQGCGGSGGVTETAHGCGGDADRCLAVCPVPKHVQCGQCGGVGRVPC
jgi:NTP pyrophosphatase (non-canonical NTP hydrolase)